MDVDEITRAQIKHASKLYKAGQKQKAIELLQSLEHPVADKILKKIAASSPKQSEEDNFMIPSVIRNNRGFIIFVVLTTSFGLYLYGYYPNSESRNSLLLAALLLFPTAFLVSRGLNSSESKDITAAKEKAKRASSSIDTMPVYQGIGCNKTVFRVLASLLVVGIIYGLNLDAAIVYITPQMFILFMLVLFRQAAADSERDYEREVERLAYIEQMRPEWGDEVCDLLREKAVSIGMTEAMVKAAWGEPRYTDQVQISARSKKHRWVYNKPHVDARYVTFTNGAVSLIKTS